MAEGLGGGPVCGGDIHELAEAPRRDFHPETLTHTVVGGHLQSGDDWLFLSGVRDDETVCCDGLGGCVAQEEGGRMPTFILESALRHILKGR